MFKLFHAIFILLSVAVFFEFCDAKFQIIHTTDIHGWLAGHPHQAELDADFGDFLSLIEHLHTQADANNDHFLLFDSGDLIEGTGLSDATDIHGYLIYCVEITNSSHT